MLYITISVADLRNFRGEQFFFGGFIMRIGVSRDIFEMFPGYVRHVLVADGADNSGENGELVSMLEEAQAAVRSSDDFADIKGHPRIASWRSAFERFGANPNQCPPSIANLIKRVRSGKNLPYINSLVCILNAISLRHVIPAGGDDLDKVRGDVLLRISSGLETYVPLGAPDEAEHPRPGEVILYDTGSMDVFCRAWCWKNGDRSRIEPSTSRAAINVDAMPPVTAAEGMAAAEETSDLARRFCGASVAIHRLSRESACIELPR
jgi:DNA/RNA-binding domain of Phe-tRNA-synthetase-like protein